MQRKEKEEKVDFVLFFAWVCYDDFHNIARYRTITSPAFKQNISYCPHNLEQ